MHESSCTPAHIPLDIGLGFIFKDADDFLSNVLGRSSHILLASCFLLSSPASQVRQLFDLHLGALLELGLLSLVPRDDIDDYVGYLRRELQGDNA